MIRIQFNHSGTEPYKSTKGFGDLYGLIAPGAFQFFLLFPYFHDCDADPLTLSLMQFNDAIAFIQNEYFQQLEKPAVWADLGCGSGLFTRALGRCLRPGSTIYAVDKKNLLESGIMKNGVEIIALQADFEKDTINREKLDGILLANSLHYVKDKLSFIGKWKRHLKDNPRFLIVEYNTDTPVHRWVPYPVSFSALSRLFKDAGFSDCKKLSERPSLFERKGMYAALLSV